MKNYLALATVAALSLSSVSFAANVSAGANAAHNGYGVTAPNTAPKRTLQAGKLSPLVDITITNAMTSRYDSILVNVISGNFTFEVSPRSSRHITNYLEQRPTLITISTPNNVPFDTLTLCPYASVTVYGYTAHDVYVDDASCSN